MSALANNEHATIYGPGQHPVQQAKISSAALKVIKQLNSAGYSAYLVGGAIRDMLMNNSPKDFDVATNATPEQVRAVFKNARIIGRRFQIVHVRFGREVIEVTTFRGHHDSPKENSRKNHRSSVNSDGMLLRDNVYGSVEEDAIRRDFTCNALYYCPEEDSVYDFTHGVEDISQRVLRVIGDPEKRFKEDPVRILRAARFAAKLDFTLEEHCKAAIPGQAPLLDNIPPARRFDELLKLLSSGNGLKTYRQLQSLDLLRYIIPHIKLIDENPTATRFVEKALQNTDNRIQQGKSVTPAFIYAVILWPLINKYMNDMKDQGLPPIPAMHEACNMALHNQSSATAIPKRFQSTMREIWILQLRLENRQGRKAFKLLEHPRFRAGYDFLLLREQAAEIPEGLGQWWTEFQVQNPIEREDSIKSLQKRPGNKRRNPRKRKNKPPQ